MTISYICKECTTNFHKGWATVKHNEESYTFCCYSCYQANPLILPTTSVFKATEDEHVIVPVLDYQDTFKFLSEEELKDLTNEQYQEYELNVDEQFLLNPIRSQVHYDSISNDKRVAEIEAEFYDSSSDSGSHDDY